MELPAGTVTFLVTDIEGSTRLLQQLGDAEYAAVLAEHRQLLRSAFAAAGGREVGTHGDAFLVAFTRAIDGVTAAIAAQRALLEHAWPSDVALPVRMGVHTGEPTNVRDDYVGLDVHRAVRVCSAGHGGQILLSGSAAVLVERSLPEGVTLRELGRHRLKDLEEPERLVQVVHYDLPADFPPLKSLTPVTNNLPRPLTSFIGRRDALAVVGRLLRTKRLVTLTGSGGCGKTRLALEIARGALGGYADGAWLVELGALTDPALVPREVATVLSIPEVSDRPLTASVTAAIAARQLLLLLDNCEHLLATCTGLVDAVLRACPSVGILATSREPLGVPGETVWRVPSLALPEPRQPFDEVARCDSVRLFVERAAAVAPEFTLTQRNAPAAAAVCRLLDGIPLAIELAAARAQALSVEQIAARLDDRFRLLTRGSRTALPRQQTLRATIDWSFDLLSEAERTMLRRLSVFAGGSTLEAAEAVCAGSGIDVSSVLDLMTQIASKSLATMNDAGGDVRCRLLETVRQYGRERLSEHGETAAVRSRHLAWYADLAERAAPELLRSDQSAWLDRLGREHDNLRAALEWCLETEDHDAGLRLASVLGRFWLVRGHLAEGRKWLAQLLQRSEGVSPRVRARALRTAGMMAVYGQSDHAGGLASYEEALSIYRSLGDEREASDVLIGLGVAAFLRGETETARDLYEQSLAICRRLDDQHGVAKGLHNLGRLAQHRHEYEQARSLMEASLAVLRTLHDQQDIAVALINLGSIEIRSGNVALARHRLLEALAIEERVGDTRRIAYLIDGFAALAVVSGRVTDAARLFGAADALRESIGASLPAAEHRELDGWIVQARERLPAAAFSDAWNAGRLMTVDEAVLQIRKEEISEPASL